MAQADLTSAPPLRVVAPKPKMTIYYALLIIALIAMLLACLFLYLEIGRFGGFGAVPGTVSSVERPAVLVAEAKPQAMRQASLSGGGFWLASA